jgi:arabinofuranosyltransferase
VSADRAVRARARAPAAPAAPAERPRLLPTWRELIEIRGPYLLPLIALLATRAACAFMLPLAAEDAYITFRYAKNLAIGNGLVFNPGERVIGFTSMPWTLWNALGIALVNDPVPWARATNLAAGVVTLLLMGRLLVRYAGVAAAACFTWFFAAWPYFAAVSNSGMESPALVAMVALCAALASGSHAVTAGLALAGVAWMRPEGVVAALVLAPFVPARGRWVALGAFAVALGATWAYFGDVVPQSVVSKARVYGAGGPWTGRHWWEWLSPIPPGRWPTAGDTNQLMLFTVLLAPAAAFGAAALARQWRTPLAGAAAALVVVWLGYVALGVTYFWWYLAPPLAGIALLAAVGLPRIVRGPAIPVTAGLLVAGMWTLAPSLYLGRAWSEHGFATVAEELAARARPGELVMLEPIGIVGYFAPLRVLDEVGLVTPEVARRRLAGPGWYWDLVRDRKPEWLVVRYGTLKTGAAFAGAGLPFRDLSERDSLLARYHIVHPTLETEPANEALVVLETQR